MTSPVSGEVVGDGRIEHLSKRVGDPQDDLVTVHMDEKHQSEYDSEENNDSGKIGVDTSEEKKEEATKVDLSLARLLLHCYVPFLLVALGYNGLNLAASATLEREMGASATVVGMMGTAGAVGK